MGRKDQPAVPESRPECGVWGALVWMSTLWLTLWSRRTYKAATAQMHVIDQPVQTRRDGRFDCQLVVFGLFWSVCILSWSSRCCSSSWPSLRILWYVLAFAPLRLQRYIAEQIVSLTALSKANLAGDTKDVRESFKRSFRRPSTSIHRTNRHPCIVMVTLILHMIVFTWIVTH